MEVYLWFDADNNGQWVVTIVGGEAAKDVFHSTDKALAEKEAEDWGVIFGVIPKNEKPA